MTIPSVAWVEKYKLKQVRFTHLYKDFLKTKATELANKLIVDPIIEEMRLMGVHEKIYQSVVVKNVVIGRDGIIITIHSEYFAENGFDVALAREEGTEDHWIRPKGSGAQFTNMSEEFRREHAGKNVLSWIQNGKRIFSGGHIVSGLPRLNIIQNRIESGELELQTKLNEEFRKWRSSI